MQHPRPKIELRNQGAMAQSLVMTPQLQQAIKLLQMSNMELDAYIETEIEKNPLLEKAEAGSDPVEASPLPAPEEKPIALDHAINQGNAAGETPTGEEDRWGEPLLAGDAESWNLSASSRDDHAASSNPSGSGSLDEAAPLAATLSLRQHLNAQINCTFAEPGARFIAFALLDQLNESGYLTADLPRLAGQLGCTLQKAEQVLKKLQQCEPTGIFARNLAECLALQLQEKGRYDPAMAMLLENLPLLAAREKDKLLKLCGVDEADFSEMVKEIRALNPKPAAGFDTAPAAAIIPDILVRASPLAGDAAMAGQNEATAWLVELNQETLPRVLVNQAYVMKIQGKMASRSEKDYLSAQLQSANWLVKALHQRATTILKVAGEIMRQQDMFFRHGVAFLKPMTLKDIATIIGMHESTVSRVTTNKYMLTPRGMFELKYFFSVSIQGCSGVGLHSAQSVRHRIKSLVEAESPTAIMSDDALVKILRREGIDIARRTVAKYREALHIPSSAQRKREKRLAG